MWIEFLCISVLRVASGPRVKLASCKSALTPPPPTGGLLYRPFKGGGPGVSLTLCCFVVYSTRRFVVCLSVCHFVLVFFSPLVLRLPRLGKRELILVLFIRLFGLCLFRFVSFLFLLGSGKGCGLWLWHSLDFSLTFIVNFPCSDGDVPRRASYGVYISQLIRFARMSSHVSGFNTWNRLLTAKLLKQGYRYHKVSKSFSKFYRRHFELVSKFCIRLISLLQQGLSEPEFYVNLIYKFRKRYACNDFST